MTLVRARTPLFPTEDREKVVQSLLFLFPSGEIVEDGNELILTAEDVDRFMDIIRQLRILDAIRSAMRQGMTEGRTTFLLNKQVASAKRVSLAEGKAPLGNIEVTIESKEIEREIDRIAPMTVNGEEVR